MSYTNQMISDGGFENAFEPAGNLARNFCKGVIVYNSEHGLPESRLHLLTLSTRHVLYHINTCIYIVHALFMHRCVYIYIVYIHPSPSSVTSLL